MPRVLHHAADSVSDGAGVEPIYEVQGHVDSGRHAGARDDIARVDPSFAGTAA